VNIADDVKGVDGSWGSRFIGWGGCGRRRRGRGFRRGEAESFIDGFQQNGHIDGLMDVGDRAGFEGGIAIANWRARTYDDYWDGTGVEKHLKSFQDDETVASGNAEIQKDEVGLFFAGGTNGGEAIARSHDFESGGLQAPGESRQLQVLVLDNHDFLSGHCEAYPLKLQKARQVVLRHFLFLNRLCVSDGDITRQTVLRSS
jgi:hypothetical protein